MWKQQHKNRNMVYDEIRRRINCINNCNYSALFFKTPRSMVSPSEFHC